MNKINFVNYPNTTTPLNATNMNQLQTNVENELTFVNEDMTTIYNEIDDLDRRINNLGLASYIDGYLNPDITTEFLILTQLGTPNTSFFFIFTLFFGSKTSTSNRTQIAIPYNYSTGTIKNSVWLRYYIDDAWTSWRLTNS